MFENEIINQLAGSLFMLLLCGSIPILLVTTISPDKKRDEELLKQAQQ